MSGEGSKTGKDLWIQNNLFPAPEEVFKSHEKYNWAVDQDGKPNKYLICKTIVAMPLKE